MAGNVITLAEARPVTDDYSDIIASAANDFQAHLAEELPKLVASLAHLDKGKGEITFKLSLGWNKDDEIEYHTAGGHKHPEKVLSDRRGEIVKGQLKLW